MQQVPASLGQGWAVCKQLILMSLTRVLRSPLGLGLLALLAGWAALRPLPAWAQEAQNSPQDISSAPKADPVADLIAQVENEYRSGLANYQAGHLAAAKLSFDRAFNLLASSPFDLHSDERLEREFDRILDGTTNLEMAAFEQGDGFTEQKSEPAPIDEANEATFPVDPNIKARAEAEIKVTRSDLPLMLTDPVVSYINYFSTRGRGTLERALTRAGRYEGMIRRVLREEGVPQDLIYLALAESGFHPVAVSRAGARGMWQFMASRARSYDLGRSWWADDRQDPEKATRAAARHLRDLYHQFGDWYLALAAYNSGPGTVQSAVKRTGFADFWELYRRNVLPRETRNYVPIIVAATIMAKNPAQYGLDTIAPDAALQYDTVRLNYPLDLRLAAECVDVSVGTLLDLNPSLLRLTTPKDRPFDLHLPAGSQEKFTGAIAAIPMEMRVWWRYHKVENGETLASLSRTYHTSADAIAQANNLSGAELEPESKILIPIAPGKRLAGEGETYSRRAIRYKVRRGDTVESVAANFGVPAERIRHWNQMRGNSLKAGRSLRVYLPVAPSGELSARAASARSKRGHSKSQPAASVAKKGRVLHKVRKGETLTSIAGTYNTTVSALRRDNAHATNLRPGDVLVVHLNR